MIEELSHVLWTEKFRPQTLSDCLIPESIKDTLNNFLKDEYLPNMLFVGIPGISKTTVAKALMNDLNAEYIIINGSKDGNIDTLRTTIQGFASTMSMLGGRKYVILDEADYLNINSTQPALRNFLEEFAGNCGFIFTANNQSRIMEPLQSRLTVINFKIPNTETAKIAQQLMKRCIFILEAEGVKYDTSVLASLIKSHFPDIRRIISALQFNAKKSGEIDVGVFASTNQSEWASLYECLKKKDFTAMRKWVGLHADIDTASIYNKLYEDLPAKLTNGSIPSLILLLAEYQYKAAFVVNQQINLAAMFTEIMSNVEFNG